MKKRKGLLVFTASLMLVPYFSMGALSVEADAATFVDINQDSVFLNQQESYTCTLCSNTMMVRRALLISGKSDWNTLTESAARSDMWMEGVGMYYAYTCRGISVDSEKITSNQVNTFINLLKVHPEGIVIYDYSYPHAILLTDYTDGQFYCADPGIYNVAGRMPVDKALITVESADCYWYVKTSLPALTDSVPLSNKSTADQTQIMAGQKVNLKGAASGGSGSYQYAFSVLEPGAKSWTVLRDYSSDASYSFMPAAAGTYQLKVTVSDSLNMKSEKTFNLTVLPNDLTNTSTLNKSSVDVGAKVIINGSATGGSKSYKYEYSVKPAGSSTWTVLRSMSDAVSAEYTAKSIGTAQIKVTVQDTYGTKSDKVLTLTVKSSPLTNKSGISNPVVTKGSSITINGNAIGGTGSYTYTFLYKKATSSYYQILSKNNIADTSVVFTPVTVSNYNLRVSVMDSSGTVSNRDFLVAVQKPALANRSTISATKINLGQSVKIIASSSGGEIGHTYAYGYAETKADALNGAEYGTAKSKTFTPTKAGTYYFRVGVMDGVGAKVIKTFTVEVLPAVSNTSKLSAYSVNAGTKVTISGAGSGGSGSYQYQIMMKTPTSSSWTYLRAYSTTASHTIKPSIKGIYQFKVNVKDIETGAVVSKTMNLKVS